MKEVRIVCDYLNINSPLKIAIPQGFSFLLDILLTVVTLSNLSQTTASAQHMPMALIMESIIPSSHQRIQLPTGHMHLTYRSSELQCKAKLSVPTPHTCSPSHSPHFGEW